MRKQFHSEEARHCRELAADLRQTPEGPFLLRVAAAFEELAEQGGEGAEKVISPPGERRSLQKLPGADTRRWTVRRKAEVVAAVDGGLISLDEACWRYSITREEFHSWQLSLEANGVPGLRVTRIQTYRNP
jgi:hypothetical protein